MIPVFDVPVTLRPADTPASGDNVSDPPVAVNVTVPAVVDGALTVELPIDTLPLLVWTVMLPALELSDEPVWIEIGPLVVVNFTL